MILRIGIADRNISYADRLAAGLARREDLAVSVFYDAESLAEALAAKCLDVLVCADDLYPAAEGGLIVLRLTEGIPGEGEIARFQRISAIESALIRVWNETPTVKAPARITAFYSPVGGAGKTTLAAALVRGLAAEGKETVFVGFEAFDSSEAFLPEDSGTEHLTVTGRLTPAEMKEMNGASALAALDQLKESGSFDAIVVDLSSEFNEMTAAVLETADLILIVERGDAASFAKMRNFYANPDLAELIQGKTGRIINFYTGGDCPETDAAELVGCIGPAEYAKEADLAAALAGSEPIKSLIDCVLAE